MTWIVEMSEEFQFWLKRLDEGSQDAIAADILVLKEFGPQLGRPYADTLSASRFTNMKELRTHHGSHHYRTAFAFDMKRQAILLCGGDKTGANQRRFYKDLIATADAIYAHHLEKFKK